MKYLKTFENNNEILVCSRNAYEPTDEEYENSPKYGRYYKVLKSESIKDEFSDKIHTFITVKDVETGQIMPYFNRVFFVTELEWNSKKYNL